MQDKLKETIQAVNKGLEERKKEIVVFASYNLGKLFASPKMVPLYSLVKTQDRSQWELKKTGKISETTTIRDFMKMYTGVKYPSYYRAGISRFETYEEESGTWFFWLARAIYTEEINKLFPTMEDKINFCKEMKWEVDTPNPEYVPDLLELYGLTNAVKLGKKPFNVFPEYNDYTIAEFISLSTKVRPTINKLFEKEKMGLPECSQIELIIRNATE